MTTSSRGDAADAAPAGERTAVRKTYKLYVGGEFPRSESGRSYPVTAPGGEVVRVAQGSRTLWMAGQLRAGVVWSNTFNRFDPASPFGGYKESGYGREGGRHGLEGYLR